MAAIRNIGRWAIVTQVVIGGYGCKESRCDDSRDLLADTPAFGLCDGDIIEFSPAQVTFDVSDQGLEQAQPAADAGVSTGLTVAVLARSPEGVARSRAEIDVFECGVKGAGPDEVKLVKLTPVGGACRAVGSARLRCSTDLGGAFEFRLEPTGKASAKGGVCAALSPRKDDTSGESDASDAKAALEPPLGLMTVNITGGDPLDLSLYLREPEVTVGASSFALGCPDAPVCEPAAKLRALPFRPTLRYADCDGGECEAFVARQPVNVDVAVEAVTTNAARFGLSTNSGCTDLRSGIAATVGPSESQLTGVYFCTDGVPGEYQVVGKLRSAAPAVRQRVTVDGDPVVVNLESAQLSSAPEVDAGDSPRAVTVAVSHRLCGDADADFWPRVSGTAILRLSGGGVPTQATVGLGAENNESAATVMWSGSGDTLTLTGLLEGSNVALPTSCAWNLKLEEAP